MPFFLISYNPNKIPKCHILSSSSPVLGQGLWIVLTVLMQLLSSLAGKVWMWSGFLMQRSRMGEVVDSFITAGPAAGRDRARVPRGLKEPLGWVTGMSMWADGRNPISGKVYPICWSSPAGLSCGEQTWFLFAL